MLNSFQHPVCFYLLSADTPFIPVHRTVFSGVILIKIFFKKGAFLKLKKGHFLLISTLILMLPQNPLAQAKLKNQFSIVYTNDVMGEIEPCG
jgi:hypothetical protein